MVLGTVETATGNHVTLVAVVVISVVQVMVNLVVMKYLVKVDHKHLVTSLVKVNHHIVVKLVPVVVAGMVVIDMVMPVVEVLVI